MRTAMKQQSNVENKPPHTANDPPNRRALAFTASTAPAKRSPRGALRAPLKEWNMVPPTAPNAGSYERQRSLLRMRVREVRHTGMAFSPKAPPRSSMMRWGHGSRSCASILSSFAASRTAVGTPWSLPRALDLSSFLRTRRQAKFRRIQQKIMIIITEEGE